VSVAVTQPIARASVLHPRRLDRLLLKAALQDGDGAIGAWDEWSHSVVLERLPHISTRLLPLLYRNLQKLNVPETGMTPTLAGTYRHAWFSNNTLFHSVLPVLHAFKDRGIDTLLIKGPALAGVYYSDPGTRTMYDFDVLVREESAQEAMELIKGMGWSPRIPRPKSALEVRHSAEFMDASGNRLDLHWHLMLECCSPGADAAFWEKAQVAKLTEIETRVLCASDQFLHTCVYGPCARYERPVRWIADAWMILEKSGKNLDWTRITKQAEHRRLTSPLQNAVFTLQALGAGIPLDAFDRVAMLNVPREDAAEFAGQIRWQRWFGQLPQLWYGCRRLARDTKGRTRRIRFPRYLQRSLGLPSIWRLPAFLFAALLRRLKRMVSPDA